MNALPIPLVGQDVDLRDFAYMPLDVVRLRDSDIATKAKGDEFRCAVLLWCAAWHQVPAASLPDDDDVLSQYAGYGRVVREWKKIKAGALRGWIKCSDGRLYHPVVAEKANDAWRSKLEQRWKTECARIKKHIQRHSMSLSIPDFDVWMSQGCPQGQPLPVPETLQGCPQGQPTVVPGETPSKGSEVKGREVNLKPTTPSSVIPTPSAQASTQSENETRLGGLCKRLRSLGIDCRPGLEAWATILPRYSDLEIISAAEIAREKKPGERIHLNYLVPILADTKAPQARGSPPSGKQALRADYLRQQGYTGGSDGNENSGGATIDGQAERVA